MPALPSFLPAVAIAIALTLSACAPESPSSTGTPTATPAATPAATPLAAIEPITTPEVHHAICGCKLEEVKHCGNYVELAGRHVPLVWPDLGVMEFCKDGAKGADIEITGEIKDGKFVAATYRRVE